MILDLRLGQRRAAVEAPMHRAQAAVNVAVFDQVPQYANLGRVVFGTESQVRIGPVGDHTQAAKVLALEVDVFLGVRAAQLAQFELGHGARLGAELARNLQFDGHPVAVPSGDERRLVTHHGARAHDEVLQNLVQGGADMDLAVGVRGPVVQDEERRVFVHLEHPLVQPDCVPALENIDLALGQVGLHREIGLRQPQGRFVVSLRVVSRFGHFYSERGLRFRSGADCFMDERKSTEGCEIGILPTGSYEYLRVKGAESEEGAVGLYKARELVASLVDN